MDNQKLIPHLFRTEFGKIATVLSKYFGADKVEVAEDIASETFLVALETWTYKGVPENPTAWLYTVAKNKAKNHRHRQQIFQEKILGDIKRAIPPAAVSEIDLTEENITDSQLQMLFAICHPSIPAESQIALALRMLCGFGIDEIANAFLTSKDTINKRLFRAREKLRLEKVAIVFPAEAEINRRLEAVLRTLYLLFSEGYYSETHDAILREDLCLEAMRLTYLLIENEQTNKPGVNALLALMCFHASRFPARKKHPERIVLYDEQDETLWNQDLISKGAYYLNQSSKGETISKYHLEAAIAYWHTVRSDAKEKWQNILRLYNQLLEIEPSPIAALNRTFALSKANGKQEAIIEAEKLQLVDNHYYFVLLGELYREVSSRKAIGYFEKAYGLARTEADKQTIQQKIYDLKS